MNYELLKDWQIRINGKVQIIPAGTLLAKTKNGDYKWEYPLPLKQVLTSNYVENNPDWFREVKEPEFKAGDWAAFEHNWKKWLFKIKEFKDGCVYSIENSPQCNIRDLVSVTPEEIKVHLDAERIKRGYTVGTRLAVNNEIGDGQPCYYPEDDDFWFGGCKLYGRGKWAEIVEDKTMVNGYEAKTEKDKEQITFGCANFSKGQFKDINRGIICFNSYDVISNRKIKSITLDSGVTIDIETIQKIVEKIK